MVKFKPTYNHDVTVSAKVCIECRVEKPADQFNRLRTARSGLQSRCRVCGGRRANEYKKTPAGQRTVWRSGLRHRHGISPKKYDALVAIQGGKCVICNEHDEYKALAVDHNHATAAIRGLLCEKCNKGLGCFRDSPELLRLAAEYIRRPRPRRGFSPQLGLHDLAPEEMAAMVPA